MLTLDNIRWKVTDPLGNEIYLSEENFVYHIIGMHDQNDAKIRQKLEEQVKYSIQNPRLIVKHEAIEGRRIYLDLVDISNENTISIRPLFVVVEENGEVVTWFAKRTVNVNVSKNGGIIYDKRIHNLQVQRKI